VDSEQWGYRVRLNASYTNKEGVLGVKLRLQSQSKIGANDAGVFSLPYAYGWIKLLKDIFTITGGLVDDSTWGSGGFLNDDQGEGLGALVKISPLTGLDLGVGGYALSQQGSGDNNTLKVDNFANIVAKPEDLKYTVNGAYTLPDVFTATVTYRNKNKTTNNESSRIILGARILAVAGLTGILEAELDNLEDYGENGIFNLYETLGYKLGDLGFGLNAAQYFRTAEKADTGFNVNPWVSYSIGPVVPRLDINYLLAGTVNSAGKYHRKTFEYKNNTTDTESFSVFGIRPSVKFNIDSKTFIEIGDLITLESGPEGAFGHPEAPGESSRFSNTLYVDFKWSF
jgi:hypothetical protein